MQQDPLLALILADQSIHNVQRHAIADGGQRVNFRHRLGQARVVGLETKEIIHAARGQAE